MALNLNYLNKDSMVVSNINDFLGQGLPETQKIKDILNNIKIVFKIQDSDIKISFIEGRIYRFDITKSKRIQIGVIYYIFPISELHFYNYGDNNPFLATRRKRVIYSLINGMIGSVDYSILFSKIIGSV